MSTISATAKPIRIAVIGGGVVGLTSALRALETLPQAHVTLIADKMGVDTTSSGAAGLWKPYAISGTPIEKINKWGKDTFEHYLQIYHSPDAPAAGIFLCPAYELYRSPIEDPVWKDVVPSYRQLTPSDVAMYDPTRKYSYGFAYDTIISEGRLYMQWVLAKMEAAGPGRFTLERRKVASFEEFSSSYDVILNCAGLGARELASDGSLHAIRGHVLRVKAPWVRYHVEAEQESSTEPAYIIPNSDTVVLGGTKQVGDEDLTPRKEDREAILARCSAAVPSLAGAEVVDEWVGLRPGRPSVRLELEEMGVGKPPVVHNYGHGGSGLTLAWGCAVTTVNLVETML